MCCPFICVFMYVCVCVYIYIYIYGGAVVPLKHTHIHINTLAGRNVTDPQELVKKVIDHGGAVVPLTASTPSQLSASQSPKDFHVNITRARKY